MKTSKEKFIKWVEGLPEDIKINYSDNFNCVICQFMKDTTGITEISAGRSYYRTPLDSHERIPVDQQILNILYLSKVKDENNNFLFSNIITKPRLLNAIKQNENTNP
ncbi:MAG TPA: hypothetical protein VF849_01355 [Blattabacteriaceae bacterium]